MKTEIPLSLRKLVIKRAGKRIASYEDGREQMSDILRLHGFAEWEIPGYINTFLQFVEDGKPAGEYDDFIELLCQEFDLHNLGPELFQDFVELGEVTQEALEQR
jgi:hypothetical protein